MRAEKILIEGTAEGPALVLEEPLSFWGGLDSETGTIIDENHPQHGQSITGKILVVERTRGCTSAPGALAECLRSGRGPAAIFLAQTDTTVLVGTRIAAELYEAGIAVVVLDPTDHAGLETGMRLTLSNGAIEVL